MTVAITGLKTVAFHEAGAASYAGHWGASHLRRPRTSQPAPGVRVYPYLLGQAEITRPNCKRRH